MESNHDLILLSHSGCILYFLQLLYVFSVNLSQFFKKFYKHFTRHSNSCHKHDVYLYHKHNTYKKEVRVFKKYVLH